MPWHTVYAENILFACCFLLLAAVVVLAVKNSLLRQKLRDSGIHTWEKAGSVDYKASCKDEYAVDILSDLVIEFEEFTWQEAKVRSCERGQDVIREEEASQVSHHLRKLLGLPGDSR